MSDTATHAATGPLPGKSPHLPGEAAVWVFVLGDMTLFSVFFCQFLWDRTRQRDVFARSAREASVAFGAIDTLILLTGSLFVVLGVQAAKGGRRHLASRLFGFTFACGCLFGANKVSEYAGKLAAGLFPRTNDYFTYYFMYTGIHAVHLLVGMLFLAKMRKSTRSETMTPRDLRFIEIGATYWHLVDLLWVVLFALLYLLI